MKELFTGAFKWAILLAFVFFGLIVFYWSFIRPSMIIKDCSKLALQFVASERGNSTSTTSDSNYSSASYDMAFKYCINDKGL